MLIQRIKSKDNKALKCSPDEAMKTMAIIQQVKELKSIYQHHRQGWSNDKERTLKHRCRIPLWMIFDKEWGKYFDPNADQHEDKKNTEAFLKKRPEFDLKNR